MPTPEGHPGPGQERDERLCRTWWTPAQSSRRTGRPRQPQRDRITLWPGMPQDRNPDTAPRESL